jgi:hypothetical protein
MDSKEIPSYTLSQSESIKEMLRLIRSSYQSTQKKHRKSLREDLSFRIEQFTSSKKGFTDHDFNQLVLEGRINIVK